ncbi:MAG TPA: DUF4873 domain-containing protein [Pseudonocardiaceae bacterium]|jgi:hypothetical protein|nr:DUF4873 domain-containing protein [Pseudonocardiaceae bacterium]
MTAQPEEHEEHDYLGPATLVVEGVEFSVEVQLRGHFQPIDGRFRWYGRIRPNTDLHTLLAGKKRTGQLTTPQGSATGEISDPDPWQRYRILGVSTPPFPLPTADLSD